MCRVLFRLFPILSTRCPRSVCTSLDCVVFHDLIGEHNLVQRRRWPTVPVGMHCRCASAPFRLGLRAVLIPPSVFQIQCFLCLAAMLSLLLVCVLVVTPPSSSAFAAVAAEWPLAAVTAKWPDTGETRAGGDHSPLLPSPTTRARTPPAPSISCQGARACVLLLWGRARLRLPGRSGARPTSRKMFHSSLVAAKGLALLGRG
eukprot:TRINITY_DN6630_c0_g1_i1.p1 TRINITY_DN6630_c0_g1~~TRINITY_DN6630_c0_g1_i1.p1  ORF type:complete len:202 (-),score=0.81 TRINITY_DN6630_c0_g1_i1:179-784(-)